jgi:hypothetical protein
MDDRGLSNPFSSGGGGTFFEARVATSYLVSLLRAEIPRGMSSGVITHIRFQARQQGVLLDDLLITCSDGQILCRLALQIKHKLTFTAADELFREVISAAWNTYTSALGWQFHFNSDRLGIGIGVITSAIREHFCILPEWARSSLSASEFLEKVNTSHFSHEQKRTYLSVLRTFLNAAAQRVLGDDEVWNFLRHLVILDFDMEIEGSRDATLAWNHLLDIIPNRDVKWARLLFDKLLAEVVLLAPLAGTIDVDRVRILANDFQIRVPESTKKDVHQQKTPHSPFQTVEQFYQPFLNADWLLHHTLPLIGRTKELQMLADFVHSQKQIAFLSGPDGIGRSRLLLEVLRHVQKDPQGLNVCMLRLPYTAAHENDLPEGPILLGIDDNLTHDMSSLDELFRMARLTGRVKLIVAISQESRDTIYSHLKLANFQFEEIFELPPLQGVQKPMDLARAILGTEDLYAINQLVTLASDSPLIMVIAGELFKRGQVGHTLLALSHDDFRQRVADLYQQTLSHHITFPISNTKVQEVREWLYAMGSFDTGDETLIAKALSFLQITEDQLLETLDLLEKVGLVLSYRNIYSSRPNALAYLFLEKACFAKNGKVKTFGSRIAHAFTEPWQTSALKRIAEVDWLKGNGKETELLAPFWRQQNEQFASGKSAERVNILIITNDVAGLQPRSALHLVHLALDLFEPALLNAEEDQSSSQAIKLYLPSILEQVVQHQSFLKEAATLLWKLGNDDLPDMPRLDNHPHQILQSISKPKYGRPAVYYDTYLQCIETWCDEPDVFERAFTPLDLIPGFLARDGYDDYYFQQTQSIHMQPFYVLEGAMKDTRKRALQLLLSIGQMSEKPLLQYQAIEKLCHIVVRGLLYNNVPDLRAQWYEEDRAILRELPDLAQKAKSAFISYTIEYKMRIALKHPENAPLDGDFRATLVALPSDLDSKIIWFLKHGISATQFSRTFIEEQEESNDETVEEIAKQLLQIYSTAPGLKKKLENIYMHLALYAQQIISSDFFKSITLVNPERGCELCWLLVGDPSSRAAQYFTYLVAPIRQSNTTLFFRLIQGALKSPSTDLRQGAIYALCSYQDLNSEESHLIITQINDTDPIIASRVITTIPQLSGKDQETALSVLNSISITPERETIVDAICQVFRHFIKSSHLSYIHSFRLFLQKCVFLPETSERKHYSLCALLFEYRWSYPQTIAAFCLDRVRYKRTLSEEQQMRYEPISCLFMSPGVESISVEEQYIEDRYKSLCMIRDAFLEDEEEEMPKIFAFLANGYDVIALQALSEWLESGEEQKLRLATRFIREAPTTFVFDNEDFVQRLLSIGNIQERVSLALMYATMPLNVVGTPDLLANERLQILEKARQVAAKHPSKSSMCIFYTKLSKEAEERMEAQRSFLAAQ